MTSNHQVRPPRYRRSYLLARTAALLTVLGLAALHPGRAAAEPRPEDLPPPSDMLLRDPGLKPAAAGGLAVAGGATSLAQPVEIPFIYEGNHIIISASIDGTPPRPFLFDTGGRLLITPDIAQGIKTRMTRLERIGGVGPKVSHAEMRTIERIGIGSVTLAQQTAAVLDVPNILVDRGSRPRLAGLIGAELLARYAVTVDYTRRILTLNASGYRPPSAQFSLPLGLAVSMDGLSHPSITAEIDGVAGEFVIDTGAGSQVFLSEKFQRDNRSFTGKTLQFLSPGGIGGRANVRMGFGRQLRIGPVSLSPPLISGVAPGDSSLSRSGLAHVAGVIGNATLSHFIVTIDLPAARAYFEPVAGRPQPTSLYGVGLVLDKPDHEGFEVLDVLKDTAAERAGLRRGDRIVEIAGRPARDLGAADVRAFNQTGERGSMSLRTSDQRRVELTFSRLLP